MAAQAPLWVMPGLALVAFWTGFGLLPFAQDNGYGRYVRLIYVPPLLCFEAFLVTFPLRFDGYISISWYVSIVDVFFPFFSSIFIE